MFDDHLAHTLQFGPGLGYQHFLAGFVDNLVGRDILFMRVPVNKGVYVIGIGSNRAAGPAGNGTVCSQMAYDKYIVRAFLARIIDSFLNRLVNLFTGGIFREPVNKFPVFILEIFRGGGNQCFRRGNPYKSNSLVAKRNDLIRFQNQLTRLDVGKVAGIITAFHPGSQLQETVHIVIEFMITGNRKIIPGCVHDLYDGLPSGQFADRRSLDRVAGIHQRHGIALFLQIFFVLGYFIDPQIVGNTAVNIIGVQDDDLLAGCQHRYRKQQRYQHCQRRTVQFSQVSGHFMCPFFAFLKTILSALLFRRQGVYPRRQARGPFNPRPGRKQQGACRGDFIQIAKYFDLEFADA